MTPPHRYSKEVSLKQTVLRAKKHNNRVELLPKQLCDGEHKNNLIANSLCPPSYIQSLETYSKRAGDTYLNGNQCISNLAYITLSLLCFLFFSIDQSPPMICTKG